MSTLCDESRLNFDQNLAVGMEYAARWLSVGRNESTAAQHAATGLIGCGLTSDAAHVAAHYCVRQMHAFTARMAARAFSVAGALEFLGVNVLGAGSEPLEDTSAIATGAAYGIPPYFVRLRAARAVTRCFCDAMASDAATAAAAAQAAAATAAATPTLAAGAGAMVAAAQAATVAMANAIGAPPLAIGIATSAQHAAAAADVMQRVLAVLSVIASVVAA
jgi:hypothetical protein